jgi:hypothetical protein
VDYRWAGWIFLGALSIGAYPFDKTWALFEPLGKIKYPYTNEPIRSLSKLEHKFSERNHISQFFLHLSENSRELKEIKFENEKVVYETLGEKIIHSQRFHDGIPIEDSYRIRYVKNKDTPHTWEKGTRPITSLPQTIFREQAELGAKVAVQFNPDEDLDFSDDFENQLTYLLNAEDNRYHLVHNFSFLLAQSDSVINVKIDAHTGEIVSIALNRFYDQDVWLKATLESQHPFWNGFQGSIGDVRAHVLKKHSSYTVPIFSNGLMKLPTNAKKIGLIFENNFIQTHLNQSPETIYKALAYEKKTTAKHFLKSHSDLETLIPMSVLNAHSVLTSVSQLADLTLENLSYQPLRLPVVVDYEDSQSCNAYFSPGMGQAISPHLVFYEQDQSRCYASAQNNSILLHEWGHYLDFATGGIVDAATSEGIGDVISMLFTKQPLIAPDFLKRGPQNYIRDLKIDRLYPLHQGQSHFEGQILGSTIWDLAVLWEQFYDEEDVFDSLQKLFLKSLFSVSQQLDFHDVMIKHLDQTGEDTTWNTRQCSLNQVFAKHGLAERNDLCERDQPGLNIVITPPAAETHHAGDLIEAVLRLEFEKEPLAASGKLVLSLWQDDELLKKQSMPLEVVSDQKSYEVLYNIELPVAVSQLHKYSLRAVYSDENKTWVNTQLALPIDRTFYKSIQVNQKRLTQIKQGWQEIPLKILGEGFVNGPIKLKLDMSIPNDKERVYFALGSSDGKISYFAQFPSSLKAIEKVWHEISYDFQGDPIVNIDKLIIINFEKNPSAGLFIHRLELKFDAFKTSD